MVKQHRQSKQSKLATIKGILNGTVSPKDLLTTAPSWLINVLYEDTPFWKDDQERSQQLSLEDSHKTIIDIEVLSTPKLPNDKKQVHTDVNLMPPMAESIDTSEPSYVEDPLDDYLILSEHFLNMETKQEPEQTNVEVRRGLLSKYGEGGGWQVTDENKQANERRWTGLNL